MPPSLAAHARQRQQRRRRRRRRRVTGRIKPSRTLMEPAPHPAGPVPRPVERVLRRCTAYSFTRTTGRRLCLRLGRAKPGIHDRTQARDETDGDDGPLQVFCPGRRDIPVPHAVGMQIRLDTRRVRPAPRPTDGPACGRIHVSRAALVASPGPAALAWKAEACVHIMPHSPSSTHGPEGCDLVLAP
ncbi:hypothetical protein CDD83_9269 [Cordyceps sp. RAO-2017]|nr:hypothetical protein CDD83_9269 [Cordyceps sp. RAO-2017]